MIQSDFSDGEYFIDCGPVSLSIARAVFGAWITVCAALTAFCIRSVWRSNVITRLLNDQHKIPVKIWRISPPTTPSEVFELRRILVRALAQGDFFFVLTSVVCVASIIVSATSTTIANHAIVNNIVTRTAVVPGRLVTSEHTTISGALVNVTARIAALDYANAPLEQLFDFAPDDASKWLFVAAQWNNTWQGKCSYSMHPAVDLTVFPSNTSKFQDEVPLLGQYLPQWATVDPTRQGTSYSGFYTGAATNDSGAWRDQVVTYVFGSVPPGLTGPQYTTTINISFANFLTHDVARDPNTTYFETSFKSDVYVAECTFDNATPGSEDQANGIGAAYQNAADNIANVYGRTVVEASIAQQAVVQPTAQQMLRYWQAYSSVKDAQYPHPVTRVLSVARPTAQIRLSALASSIGILLCALMAALVSRCSEPRDPRGKRIGIPASQFAWIAQAARERQRVTEMSVVSNSAVEYAMQRDDLTLFVSAADGRIMWIESTAGSTSPIEELK